MNNIELLQHVNSYRSFALYVSHPGETQMLVLRPDKNDTVRFLRTVKSPDPEAVWIAFGTAKVDRLKEMYTEFVDQNEPPDDLGILIEKLVDVVGMAQFEEQGEYDIFRVNDMDEIITDFMEGKITYRFID